MTLLEVLLAMAVLALGVFASAALQLRSLQVSDSAHLDGQAVQRAQNMLERARAVGSPTAAGELSLELDWSAPGDAPRPSLSRQGKVLP